MTSVFNFFRRMHASVPAFLSELSLSLPAVTDRLPALKYSGGRDSSIQRSNQPSTIVERAPFAHNLLRTISKGIQIKGGSQNDAFFFFFDRFFHDA